MNECMILKTTGARLAVWQLPLTGAMSPSFGFQANHKLRLLWPEVQTSVGPSSLQQADVT